jgi:hypothetical protein
LDFRWNEWNIEHVARQAVEPEEAEHAIRGARKPYPRAIGDDKLLVWGRGRAGQLIQVIFVLDQDGTAFVLHARPLTDTEKRLYRSRGR